MRVHICCEDCEALTAPVAGQDLELDHQIFAAASGRWRLLKRGVVQVLHWRAHQLPNRIVLELQQNCS